MIHDCGAVRASACELDFDSTSVIASLSMK